MGRAPLRGEEGDTENNVLKELLILLDHSGCAERDDPAAAGAAGAAGAAAAAAAEASDAGEDKTMGGDTEAAEAAQLQARPLHRRRAKGIARSPRMCCRRIGRGGHSLCCPNGYVLSERQTSFIKISIEAGILQSGNGAIHASAASGLGAVVVLRI